MSAAAFRRRASPRTQAARFGCRRRDLRLAASNRAGSSAPGEPCGAPRARRVDAPRSARCARPSRARCRRTAPRARPGACVRNAPALGNARRARGASSSAKPITDPALRCLVAVAIYQLDHTRAPSFAIVDHAVNAAAIVARPAAKPLANAVLRRYLRERESLHAAIRDDPLARWSHPAWWIARLQRDYPDAWESILAAGNARPPLALRVNRRVTTREALLASWEAAAIAGVRARRRRNPRRSSTPGRGASRLRGRRVLGPGSWRAARGAAAAARMRVSTCSTPVRRRAASRRTSPSLPTSTSSRSTMTPRGSRASGENLDRLRLASPRVRVLAGDAGEPSQWWNGRPFDRILVDVPCTASGRGPPPPRRQMAAPRIGHRAVRRTTGAHAGRAVAVPRPRRAASLRNLLGLRSGKRGGRSRRLQRVTRKRCANPSPLLPASPIAVHNSCHRRAPRATIKMDFSTHCSASPDGPAPARIPPAPTPRDPFAPRPTPRLPACPLLPPPSSRFANRARSLACLRAAACAIALALVATIARADTIAVKSAEIRADEDAYVLNAEFDLALNPTLEEALQKGVPLYFELEFELVRPRKYWFDEKVLSSFRRNTASPTTRSRASIASRADSSRRPSTGWTRSSASFPGSPRVPIARADELQKGMRYEAAIRLRLDVNQLPKPFQLNALASREWSLQSEWHRWSFTP